MYINRSPLESETSLELVTSEKTTGMLAKEIVCAWKGCKSQYKGELPPGWRKVLIFKDDDNPFKGEVNVSLCPAHLKELGKFLKVGYKLAETSAE